MNVSMLEPDMKVEYQGKIYEAKVKNGLKTLKLYNIGIKDITEINGLDKLTDLQVLNLAGNKITEIKGLENLTNLEKLYLYNNQITEIKGLENMTKLSYFTAWKNPFHKLNKDKFGGTGYNGEYKDPQAVVRYCQHTPEQREAEQIEVEKIIEERIIEEQIEEEQFEEDQIETEKDTVEYSRKLHEVKIKGGLKTLKLYNMGIKDITKIKGLDRLTDLQVLNLAGNKITEIKGLENLTNLEKLYLYNNQITEIKGLENMTKLSYFTVWKNPFHKLNKDKFGGTGYNGQYKDPQAVVRYCQLTPEQREEERIIEERIIEEQIEEEQTEEEQIEIEHIEDEQVETEKQTVEFDGKSYEVKVKSGLKTLRLYNIGIKNITEIIGLDKLTDLQVLNLSSNKITEIKGLENLTNLEKLLLYNNQITEIEGIDNLTKLRYFTVWKNPFHKLNKDKFGGTEHNGQYKDPQAAVEYSQHAPERREARRIEAERIEAEIIEIKRLEAERVEAERIEIKRLEAERVEKERIEKERQRIEAERLKAERIEREGIEKEARRIKTERIKAERIEKKRLEAERVEKKRIEKERQRIEAERLKAERIEGERIKREAEEERIKTETTLNIKKLSIAYKEITFEKISSKTSLDIEYLENLVENLIISQEIDAEINGDTLIFRKTVPVSKIREIGITPKNVEIIKATNFKQPKEIKENIIVFVSYATKDEELFKVKEIAEILTNYKNIEDVLYWQEDMEDNIIKFMSDSVSKCDVMLLFCSPNALKSKPIEKEWTTADIMNIPIIPIFVKPDHIPPLLKTRLGIEFDTFDQQETIEEIYNLILKKS